MSRSKPQPLTIAKLNDIILGGLGASIPPHETLNHAARFFGTWSGSDKLFGLLQHSAKLLVIYLEWRAKMQFKNGKRVDTASPAAVSLRKLATLIGDSRVLWGIWGLLPIIQWLSALERSQPPSRNLLTLERCQALSMAAFYPLEHASFFARQGILPASLAMSVAGKKVGRIDFGKWGLYSCRCWMAYVVLQLVHLKEDWEMLRRSAKRGKEVAGRTGDGDDEAGWRRDIERRRKALLNELVVNLGYLPLTIHWSLPNGLFKNELWPSLFAFTAAIASFRGGWLATAAKS